MKCLERRITGTEMEYSGLSSNSNGRWEKLEYDQVKHIINHYLPQGIEKVGGFTTNGSRIYPDMLAFFEYATPEDDSIIGTVVNEIAGERIVQRAYANAKADGYLSDFCINKRVLSDNGETWGYHASFAADRRKISLTEQGLGVLGLHLASMNIYAGAGAIWHKSEYDGGTRFALSQKQYKLNREVDKSSHNGSEPLLNIRDEALSNVAWNISRIHVTAMDPNISPWATWMKLGTTSIVLRLMENGYVNSKASDIAIDYGTPMYEFAKNVADDPTLKYAVPHYTGEYSLRALDIQRKLYERAELLNLPPQEAAIMPEWKRALDDLEEDPMRLDDRADWVIKKRIIERIKAKREADGHKLAVTHDSIVRALWYYDLLDPERSLGIKMRERGVLKQWMPPEKEIENAIEYPPETTRAKLRSEFMRELSRERPLDVKWERVEIKETTLIQNPSQGVQARRTTLPSEVRQLHPYQTEWDEDINKLMQ